MKVGYVEILDHEFRFEFVRSPGAGGQNVNKVNSKAVLRWSIKETKSLSDVVKARFYDRWKNRINSLGDVVVASSKYREQIKNKQDVMEKLASMIEAVLLAPKNRKNTKPSRASKERRLKAKKQRSEIKSGRKNFKFD